MTDRFLVGVVFPARAPWRAEIMNQSDRFLVRLDKNVVEGVENIVKASFSTHLPALCIFVS